jgi:hypothetical protein
MRQLPRWLGITPGPLPPEILSAQIPTSCRYCDRRWPPAILASHRPHTPRPPSRDTGTLSLRCLHLIRFSPGRDRPLRRARTRWRRQRRSVQRKNDAWTTPRRVGCRPEEIRPTQYRATIHEAWLTVLRGFSPSGRAILRALPSVDPAHAGRAHPADRRLPD